MITAFETSFDGGQIRFETQCALGQLTIGRETSELLPMLAATGLEHNEAYALAYNCALLAQVLCGEHACDNARKVLRRFTLSEIAGLTRVYFEHGDLPFDENAWDGCDECGVNESFGTEASDV